MGGFSNGHLCTSFIYLLLILGEFTGLTLLGFCVNCRPKMLVVLVATGSFNPPTYMHLRMFGELLIISFILLDENLEKVKKNSDAMNFNVRISDLSQLDNLACFNFLLPLKEEFKSTFSLKYFAQYLLFSWIFG